MDAFISPPARIPWYLRLGLSVAERRGPLLPARLLAWYPRAAIGSGVLEALVAHHDGRIDERMLKLVRMSVSFTVNCPFCIGLNSLGWEKLITADELASLQGDLELFVGRERLAIEYARLASSTPLVFTAEFGASLAASFSPRELVVLATTSAQVNYWARLVQGLGVPAS
jgi:alkylhydroperoxidase family enzyme